MQSEIPSQKKLISSVKDIPVEYFKWGTYPDHFKIDMPHRHEFAELLFFTNGGGIHEIEYEDYKVKSGSIHYIPKSIVHFLKRDIHSNGFTISMDMHYFEKNNTHKFLNPLNYEPFVLNLSDPDFYFIQEQTKHLLHQIKQDKGYYQKKCFLLSMELMLNTIAAAQQKHLPPSENVHKNELIRNFEYQVKTNIHLHHSVSWYADQLHISVKHLGNQVKKHLGVSAKQHLQEALLGNVKKSLFDSNKRIKQIAFEHNYDESALGKLFKKHVGYTMKAYRSYSKEIK